MQQVVSPPHGRAGLKIVVLDDDPTGSQTVHSAPLLLRWDGDSLRRGLADPSPFLFLLANTRALDPEAAAARVRQIGQALRSALRQAHQAGEITRWLIVSRGDSTLRGHFPLEVETLAAMLGEVLAPGAASERCGLSAGVETADAGAPGDAFNPGDIVNPGDTVVPGAGESSRFDACLLVPAFLAGGRTTVEGVHLLEGVPVHTTPFGRDGRFGFSSSFLPDWIAEKSGGRITAASVERLTLAELDAAAVAWAAESGAAGEGFAQLCRRLACLSNQRWVAVDAERPEQLAALGAAVQQLTDPATAGHWGTRPRRFLFQSAASLLNGLVDIGPQPLDAEALAALRRRNTQGPRPGLVLVGSHVPLADRQLSRLLADRRCSGVELAVTTVQRVLEGPLPDRLLPSLEAAWLQRLHTVLAQGRTPVLFTSRGEVRCSHPQDRIVLGLTVAQLMARLAAALAPQLGYVISKGGITTHTLLAEGLQLASVQLQGQLLPGLSLVLAECGSGEQALPVLTFPGNLGDEGTLWQAWRRMESAGAL